MGKTMLPTAIAAQRLAEQRRLAASNPQHTARDDGEKGGGVPTKPVFGGGVPARPKPKHASDSASKYVVKPTVAATSISTASDDQELTDFDE
jgi:hypothetical protein